MPLCIHYRGELEYKLILQASEGFVFVNWTYSNKKELPRSLLMMKGSRTKMGFSAVLASVPTSCITLGKSSGFIRTCFITLATRGLLGERLVNGSEVYKCYSCLGLPDKKQHARLDFRQITNNALYLNFTLHWGHIYIQKLFI